jgi:hypothetical protein
LDRNGSNKHVIGCRPNRIPPPKKPPATLVTRIVSV